MRGKYTKAPTHASAPKRLRMTFCTCYISIAYAISQSLPTYSSPERPNDIPIPMTSARTSDDDIISRHERKIHHYVRLHDRKRLVSMCLFILPSKPMRFGYIAPSPLPRGTTPYPTPQPPTALPPCSRPHLSLPAMQPCLLAITTSLVPLTQRMDIHSPFVHPLCEYRR